MYLINTNGLGVVPHTDSYGFVIGKRHHNKAQILANSLHGLHASVAFVTETHENLSSPELLHLNVSHSTAQGSRSGAQL